MNYTLLSTDGGINCCHIYVEFFIKNVMQKCYETSRKSLYYNSFNIDNVITVFIQPSAESVF